jgi:hypothetical protein
MTTGATTGRQSNIYRENTANFISDSIFRNSEFIPLFRFVDDAGGADEYGIPQIVAANDSAQVYIEDQALPDAGYQQTIQPKASFKHFRVVTRVTGHARRRQRRTWDEVNAPGVFGGVDIETMKAKQDLLDIVNTTFMANAIHGIVGIVDDDTTAYYDTSRSTYTSLKSYVKTASAALSAALLDRLLQETYNQPYGGRIQMLLMAPAQARKYSAIVHGKVNPLARTDVAGAGIASVPPYGGVPGVVVRDLSATVILGLSGMDTDWFYLNNEPAAGGIDIKMISPGSDAMVDQISTSGALICTAPQRQGKLETLGTT